MGRAKQQPRTIDRFPDPPKPGGLGERASRWWDHVIRCKPGQIGPLEAFLMEQGCDWLRLYDQLQAEAAKFKASPVAPPQPVKRPPGRPRKYEPRPNEGAPSLADQNPVLTIPRLTEIAKAVAVVQSGFLRVCGELGLTPRAASRVKLPKVIDPGGSTGRHAGAKRSALDSLKPTDFPSAAPPPRVFVPADDDPDAGADDPAADQDDGQEG